MALRAPSTLLIVVLGGLIVERYMDLLTARQNLVASNIANADTPGYHTQDIDFQREFQNAAGGLPRSVEVQGLQVKNDGNDVSLARCMRISFQPDDFSVQ